MLEDLLKPRLPFSWCCVCEEPFPINLTGETKYCSSTCMGMHHEFTGGTLQPEYYDEIKEKDFSSKSKQREWVFSYFIEICRNFQLPLKDYTPSENQTITEKLIEFKENFSKIKNKIKPPIAELEEDMLIRFINYLVNTQYWYVNNDTI